MDEEIQALTQGLSRCDEAAWHRFHDQFYQTLHGLAVSKGIPACDAPAIVQGVYLRVLRHAKPFTDLQSFHAWLACLLRCEVIDTARKVGRRSWLNERFQQWQEMRSPENDSPATDRLEVAMSGLDESEQSLIRRFYLDGWTQGSLAEEHQISVKAVESKLARLRKRLRKSLEESTTQFPI